MTAPRAVLIDAMGTLVRLRPPEPLLAAALREHAGVQVTEEEAGRGFAAEVGYYMQHQIEGRDAESLADLRRRCAAVLAGELGLGDADPEAVTRAMMAGLAFEAYPDSAPALRGLRARGVKVVAASNWDCSLPEFLAGAGLWDLLDGAATSAEAGAAKPARAVFDRALALAGVGPDEAVHVGDSPEADIEGAAAAGIRGVLLVRDGRPPEGAVGSLAELPALLFGA